MTIYKIRDKDGLYSLGGYYPSFDQKGKVWLTKRGLNAHLHLVNKVIEEYGDSNPYTDCHIVEFCESGIIQPVRILE